jgi:hypothetical protein
MQLSHVPVFGMSLEPTSGADVLPDQLGCSVGCRAFSFRPLLLNYSFASALMLYQRNVGE